MAKGARNVWFALVLGWLLPGLGHFYLRRQAHGLFYAVVIGGLYALGVVISRNTAVNLDIHPWYFFCQLLAGPVTPGLEAIRGHESVALGETIAVLDHQTGVVYTALAGVLNLISLCELFRRWAAPEAPGPSDTLRADAVSGLGGSP